MNPLAILAAVLFLAALLGWIKALGQESIIRELRSENEQLAEALVDTQARQIVTTLDLREARRERDAGREALRKANGAIVLAREIVTNAPIPLLPAEPTPLFDATVAHEQEVMADVLRFRKQIDALDGGEGA